MVPRCQLEVHCSSTHGCQEIQAVQSSDVDTNSALAQVQGPPPQSRARQALLAEAPQDVSAYLSEPDLPVAAETPKTPVSTGYRIFLRLLVLMLTELDVHSLHAMLCQRPMLKPCLAITAIEVAEACHVNVQLPAASWRQTDAGAYRSAPTSEREDEDCDAVPPAPLPESVVAKVASLPVPKAVATSLSAASAAAGSATKQPQPLEEPLTPQAATVVAAAHAAAAASPKAAAAAVQGAAEMTALSQAAQPPAPASGTLPHVAELRPGLAAQVAKEAAVFQLAGRSAIPEVCLTAFTLLNTYVASTCDSSSSSRMQLL